MTTTDFPKNACKDCLERIESFGNLISELPRGQERFYTIKETMLYDLDSENHTYDCKCEICGGNKCGLTLLTEAIEEKESQRNRNTTPSTSQPGTSSTTNIPNSHNHSRINKEMKCNYCMKVFSHRGDMNKHLRTHTGEQPYSCEICQRKFKHTSNLKRHLAVHSGNKPFECNLCGKKFNRKDKMESHRKTKICRKHSASQE